MQKLFDTLYRHAERLISSDTLISKLIDKAAVKAGELSEKYYQIQDSVIALTRMLRAWLHGDYKNISTKTIIAVIAALIYFVNPIDLIPDFIPVIGQLDDIFILGYLIKILNKEIERFMAWEETQASSTKA